MNSMIFRLFLIGEGQSNKLLYSCSTTKTDLGRLLNLYERLAQHCNANGPIKVHEVIQHFVNFHRSVLNDNELLNTVIDVYLIPVIPVIPALPDVPGLLIQPIFQDPPLTDQILVIFPDDTQINNLCHQIEMV
jgi:hypothetical protein